MKSKKTSSMILIAALILAMAVPSLAFATEQQGVIVDKADCAIEARILLNRGAPAWSQGSRFVDNNGDGICDYCPREGQRTEYTGVDGDGHLDAQMMRRCK